MHIPILSTIAGRLLLPGVALALTCATPASAQQPADDTPRRYLVEVIVFKHEGHDSSSGERWAAPEFELPPASTPAASTDPLAVEYTELEHLARALRDLDADAQYRPLTYRAWLQSLSGRSQAPQVPLSAPSAYRAGVYAMSKPLEGWLRVFESHLLFVEIELTARFGPDRPSMATSRRPIDNAVSGNTVFASESTEFRISEKRRVKLNEVHYFDHPKFGAVVRVSRAEPTAAGAQ